MVFLSLATMILLIRKENKMSTDLIIFGEQVEKIRRAQMLKGMNGNAKVAIRRQCRFRTFEMLRLELQYNFGKLPEPRFTLHKFLRRTYN
jgi:hypothetical protein